MTLSVFLYQSYVLFIGSNNQFRNHDTKFSHNFRPIRTSFTIFLCFCQKQSDWLNDSGFIFSVLVVGSGEQDINLKIGDFFQGDGRESDILSEY